MQVILYLFSAFHVVSMRFIPTNDTFEQLGTHIISFYNVTQFGS